MKTSTPRPALGPPCVIETVDYQGWEAIKVSNGILDMFVTPQIGGRVIQLRLGKCEYFYVNPRHMGRMYGKDENNAEAGWKNYGGSKVWPAPQGWSDETQWPGPPDPILDGGPYRAQVIERGPDSVAIKLESGDDEYTGLRLSREIRLFRGSATVQIRHQMRNTSLRPVRWAVWQVTQQAARVGFSATVPLQNFRQIYGDQNYENFETLSGNHLWRLSYANQVAKFVVNPASGWLATSHGDLGAVLVETFPIFQGSAYPDGGPLEFWINGKGSFTAHGEVLNVEEDPNGCDPFIETEILSPMIDLEPDQDYEFQVSWHCCTTDEGTISGVNSCAAIARPLVAEVEDGNVHVMGSFGLFHSGILEVAPIQRSGKNGPAYTIGEAGPLKACLIDESIPFDGGVCKVDLRLRDMEGKFLGIVDGAIIV
jgi:hypothetical protein